MPRKGSYGVIFTLLLLCHEAWQPSAASNHFPTVHGLNSKPPIDFCLTAAYLGLEKFSQQKRLDPWCKM